MWKLKRKKKQNIGITREDVRQVIKEELLLADANQKKLDEDKKKKLLQKQRLNALPVRARLKLLRYISNKERAKHEKD